MQRNVQDDYFTELKPNAGVTGAELAKRPR
jgi:hypothetical protein